MTRIVSRFPLPPMSLGTERYLTVHTYGDPDATPKVYIQAATHAGELAGSLALHHLDVQCRCLNHSHDPTPRVGVHNLSCVAL